MTDLEKLREVILETLENHLRQYAKDVYFKAPEPEKDVYVNAIIQAISDSYVLKADVIAGAEVAAGKITDKIVNIKYTWEFMATKKTKQIILDSMGVK